MTIKQLRDWQFQNSLADEWWMSSQGITEEEPVTLEFVALYLSDGLGDVKVLHVSQAGLSPAPWMKVTHPNQQPDEAGARRARPAARQEKSVLGEVILALGLLCRGEVILLLLTV